MNILVSTSSFGEPNKEPIKLLEKNGINFSLNPYNRKLTEDEINDLLPGHQILIAGTETISKRVLDNAKDLKFISRVGVGLDGIDLSYAKDRDIRVSYTPSAPSSAVAELSLAHILSLIRHIPISNLHLHSENWSRKIGSSISELTIGLVGAGRIGSKLINLLQALNVKEILIYDVNIDKSKFDAPNVSVTNFKNLLSSSDVISLHLPLNKDTKNLISKKELLEMKKEAILINTSRGGIINEADLFDVMSEGHLAGIGLDVFEEEPYRGNLTQIDRALLTAHLGPMSNLSRVEMEVEAVKEVIRYINGENLQSPVPIDEYNSSKL